MIANNLLKNNKRVWLLPLSLMLVFFVTHILFQNYSSYLLKLFTLTPKDYLIEHSLYMVMMSLCTYWLCVRLVNQCFRYLKKNLIVQKYSTLAIIFPFINAVLKAVIFLMVFNFLIDHLDIPDEISYPLNKLSSVLIICAISWVLFKLIDLAEQLLLNHYTAEVSGSSYERKIFTQTLILKRVAYSLVSVLSAGAILILFDNVRALGASVLTTAGVVGLVLTFTAQRSLASIFSGLEIALTQPIKIGDSILIDKEFGVVEEINFRNVVVKLWDWRRLVVPTSFFLEKPFENWTRAQNANLLGTVFVYVDFTLPVADVRNQLHLILCKTPYWDKNVAILQVGDLQERVMQLKILASARNPDDLSNLRAFIREEIISYIVKTHPYALPKNRNYALKNDFETIESSQEKILQELYS